MTAINVKILAIAVVAIVVVASAGVLLLTRGESRNEEVKLVLGMEAVGSGIYYDPARIDPSTLFVLDDQYDADENGPIIEAGSTVLYRAAGWNKLIFGTPTATAVQHFQLKTIVEQYLNDPSKVENGETREYKLVAWQEGVELKDGEVGYVLASGTATTIREYNPAIGLTWQPQLQHLVAETDTTKVTYKTLVRTNELFPDQTCCVLYVNASFYAANPELSERFVWAVIQATEWLNAAKAAGAKNFDDEDYQKLLAIGQVVGGSGFTAEELAVALNDVLYDWWSGDPDNPLAKVKEDIADQTDIIAGIGGIIYNSVQDLGFNNSTEYADRFVDDSLVKSVYQKYYVGGTGTYDSSKWNTPTSSGKSVVRVGLINGDIHQLPIHIADTLLPGQTQTFFEQAGITIEKVGSPAGAGVLTSLKANAVDFAVNAQPALITDNINNKLTVNN